MSLRNCSLAVFVIAAVFISWCEAKPSYYLYIYGMKSSGYNNLYEMKVSNNYNSAHIIQDDCASCDDSCDSYFNGLICKECIPGYRCEPGYVRNSTADDDSIKTAACIKPEQCDPKYDRRSKDSSVVLTSESLNPAEQNNVTPTINPDVTTEYITQSSDNSENYSTTLSDNIENSSTIAPDSSENYSATLSENTENSSTITPDSNENYSTTLSENIGDYSTHLPKNNEDFSTIAATEETTTVSL
ncbi:hypothetical protein PV327_006526 [Microctonus hyperodae]|uniref:Uncharacterized protein n=1 Tax=Microctonus hyperodae TaxID=165561 RepID=A0AA39F4G1_MICHY|nr:hypothetical protein PV327_006526 [Microctonus hyperodae]